MTMLIDRAAIAEDPTFQRRVRQAIVSAAAAVRAEPLETDNYGPRQQLAAAILANPNGWASVYAIGVAQNANIGLGGNDDPAESDSPMEYVVNSLFDAYTIPEGA